jgi:hypothetical protein
MRKDPGSLGNSKLFGSCFSPEYVGKNFKTSTFRNFFFATMNSKQNPGLSLFLYDYVSFSFTVSKGKYLSNPLFGICTPLGPK